MTQLALLIALGSLGLVLSFVLGRVEVRRGPVAPTVKRLESALERAALGFLRGATGSAGLLLLIAAATLVTWLLAFAGRGTGASSGGLIAFLLLALAGGAMSTFVYARLVIAIGARACSAASSAVARGSSRCLRPLLRGPGALAGVGESLGLLSLSGAFAALYAVRGGFAHSGSPQLASEVTRLLPAFALGAAVATLALSRRGSTLATAASVGGSHVSEREAQLDRLDPRNPATLAELLGEQLGGLLPRALVGYVAGVSATVAAGLLAVAAVAQPAPAERPLTYLLLVLTVRGFGIIGSLCGVFAARSEELERPERALLRGQLSAFVISAFGLGAALYWLRVESFSALLVPGLAGLTVATLVPQLAWLPLRRSAKAARETLEARSLGDGAAVARGASAGLFTLLPSLLLPVVALWLMARVPASGVAPGAALVAASFVSGLLATLPFSLAVAGFGLLCEASLGTAALARLEGDGPRPSTRLGEAGEIGGGAAASHTTLALAASLLLGLFALQGASEGTALVTRLAVACAAIVVVLAFAARSSQTALTASRSVADEVRRQLQVLPRRQGIVSVPSDFSPSYKACLESALGSAGSASLVEPIWAILAPFVLALALSSGERGWLELQGFAVAAVLCGVVFVLGSRATRVALREARRRSKALEPAPSSSLGGAQNFGDVVGMSAAASVEALICVLALSVLSLISLHG